MDTDKKLELIRSIRNMNQHNQTLLRSREHLLYGEPAPLIKKGELYGAEIAADPEEPTIVNASKLSSFKLRLFLAIILFCAFLFCDRIGYELFGMSMEEVAVQMTREQDELSSISAKLSDLF